MISRRGTLRRSVVGLEAYAFPGIPRSFQVLSRCATFCVCYATVAARFVLFCHVLSRFSRRVREYSGRCVAFIYGELERRGDQYGELKGRINQYVVVNLHREFRYGVTTATFGAIVNRECQPHKSSTCVDDASNTC